VVLPLPEPHAARLRAVRAGAGDPLASVPAHLTLVTGAVVSDWDAVREHVRAVAAVTPPAEVGFRGAATFRPLTPVVYAPVATGERWCRSLHAALQAGPLDGDPAYPFVPHVTLAHGVDEAVLDGLMESQTGVEFSFRADRLALYADAGDGLWRPLGEHPLLGA